MCVDRVLASGRLAILVTVQVLLTATWARAATILLTADTEGHLGPCRTCPGDVGLGGLAKRATLLEELRKSSDGTLLLDAGNAFFGGETVGDQGRTMLRAYEALDYDAVNISYRDFRLGRAATLSLLSEAPIEPVSANILDAQSAKPLFEPFALVSVGGETFAVVGLTERPAALATLPLLQRQLEGVRIEDPVDAFQRVLPAAKAQAKRILVLYYGSSASAAPLLAAAKDEVDALLFGGLGVSTPPRMDGIATATAESRGRAVTRLSLGGGVGGDETRSAESIAVTPDLADAPALLAILEEAARADEPVDSLVGNLGAATKRLPDELEVGKRYDLSRYGENRGLRVDVLSATLEPEYGETAATEGSLFLVLDTMWESQVAFDLVLDLDYPEAVEISALSRQCFLVVDGQRTVRLAQGSDKKPGQLPGSFLLSEAGALAQGRIAFEIPRAGVESLELRFYHAQYAPIAIPLMGDLSQESQTPAAVGSKRNKVVELGVYGFKRMPEYREGAAPSGMLYAIVDLRGRSLMTRSIDARALDEAADARAKKEIGLVFEYLRAADTLHVLVDGEYACPLEVELSSTSDDPALLPDLTSGGRLLFVIPEQARSVELACDFAQMRMTTGEDLGFPESLRIDLMGAPTPPPERQALAAIADKPAAVGLMAARLVEEFAGRGAPAGRRFAIVDITVKNESREHGLYSTAERFRLEAGGEKPLDVHAVTHSGPYRPSRRPLWLTPGARRSFQLVYAVPERTKVARLVYTGVEVATAVEIDFEKAELAAANADTSKEREAPLVTSKPASPPSRPVVTGSPPREPKGLAGVGLSAKQVNEAIDRGRDFLWQYIKDEELKGQLKIFPSSKAHTIAALALLHAGASKVFPDFDQVLRGWLGGGQPGDPNAPPNSSRRGQFAIGTTYVGSVYCMAIDAYGDPLFFPALERMAKSLVEGQYANGSWSYSIPRGEKTQAGGAPSQPLTVLGASGDAVKLTRDGEWKENSGDNSATQFALLGLRAARRRGVHPPDETWGRALRLYTERQHQDGGWSYHTGSSYGSMTCAGGCSILLSQWGLGSEQPHVHPAIPRGLSWLAQNFSVTGNPKRSAYHFYYLYSLERVGRLFDTEFIGEHEWYPLGVKALLGMQKKDGGWIERNDRIVPTSFALLFLTRATEKLTEEEPEGPGTLRVVAQPQPESRLYLILDASGSMLAKIGERTKFEIAQECVQELVYRLPENQEVALRVYGHRKNALEKDADKDTALEVPMKAWTASQRQEFASTLSSLRPRGKTPLALSLSQAARDIARLSRKKRNTVVLLTDGGEDTRARLDPVESAGALAKLKNTNVVVVGFDIDDAAAVKQVQGIAEAAGGAYWPASHPDLLRAALQAAARRAPERCRVLDESGKMVSELALEESMALEPGTYTVNVPFGRGEITKSVRISQGRKTTVVFDPAAVRPAAGVTTGESKKPATPPATAAKFCTECGTKAAPGAKFCTRCGHKLQGR